MKTAASSTTRAKRQPTADPVFDGYMVRLQARLVRLLAPPDARLYTTSAEHLFAKYLDGFSAKVRQHHNCSACHRFLHAYGGLVTIDERGDMRSALWDADEAPPEYRVSVAVVAAEVETSEVTGVFYSKEIQLGTPTAGGWTHLAVGLPTAYVSLHPRTLTPGQARAAKREDRVTILRAMEEFTPEALGLAVQVLQTEALYRSEKLLGAAEWLRDLQATQRAQRNTRRRHAQLWRAIALAPAGFCHPRTGMLGTLLEDIQAGLPFAEIKRRFDAKMDPIRYQRPQAAPAVGTIAQAEKLVEQLGLAPALRRRFARLEEVEAIWQPRPAKAAPAGGVFSHLKPKEPAGPAPLEVAAGQMTWEKFQRTILPTAESIECLVPGSGQFCQLTAAVVPEAPPLLQWDDPSNRNPFAWYVYRGGASAHLFSLLPARWVTVPAITLQPSSWRGRSDPHHGESVLFLLDGCRDTTSGQGLGLFPECIRSELHAVRSVIEAYSNRGAFEQVDGAVAAGLRFQKGAGWTIHLRVTAGGTLTRIDIDRWD